MTEQRSQILGTYHTFRKVGINNFYKTAFIQKHLLTKNITSNKPRQMPHRIHRQLKNSRQLSAR